MRQAWGPALIAIQADLGAEWALCDLENAVTTGKTLSQVAQLLHDSNCESEPVVVFTTLLIVSVLADECIWDLICGMISFFTLTPESYGRKKAVSRRSLLGVAMLWWMLYLWALQNHWLHHIICMPMMTSLNRPSLVTCTLVLYIRASPRAWLRPGHYDQLAVII